MKTYFFKFLSFFLIISYSAGAFSGNQQENNQRLVYKERFAPTEGLVNKYEKQHRQEICINGYWDFQGVSLPSGYMHGKGIAPELPRPQEGAWDKQKIKIPSPWNINSFANRDLEGPDHRNYPSYPKEWEEVKMAWMRKSVTIPSNWTGKVIKLHFEAVAGFTEVYIKDKKVAENFDIFLPFDADITNMVTPGETIEILVGVRSQSLFEDNSTIGRRIVPAGSMWGYHIAGIWQDVFLYALPAVHIEDIYIKPLVSAQALELEVTIKNQSGKKENLTLQGDVKEWINKAGNEINSAPVPNWELGHRVLNIPTTGITLAAGQRQTYTIRIPVKDELEYWTPNQPNLYGILLSVNDKKQSLDTKYERFGWREWTIKGTQQYLNGQPYELRGDSWHFMGIPQMTRRYAWAWFKAIKEANGNAVRPHAQIYPRFYLDMADEMGICVMNETAIWASDGGPKMDSDKFWEACKEHIRRFVLRDRNHASVFGWSISNENKPVINHVYNRPELMEPQKQAWKDWLEIVTTNDPTRPWVSSDGEDDGEGILPVTVGHYGDENSMRHWVEIGKPWGIGEHSMAYYGTPEQVSVYNGEYAYVSQEKRMEGLANECYHLIASQRRMNASYISVFNLAWYALKLLPLGKKDLTTSPSLTEDGVFFTEYVEGIPGVQPERMGPYCSTFNPGYDPNLPLYDPWPMYDAMRAAYAPGGPAWSTWMEITDKGKKEATGTPLKRYTNVVFIGEKDSRVKNILDKQGVIFSSKTNAPSSTLYIIDGTHALNGENEKLLRRDIEKGADIWIWGITPQTLPSLQHILPLPLEVEPRVISSFLPESKSWTQGMNNSDFYFCELQQADASQYGMKGQLVNEGEVLLNACNTDWRKWNKRPEELKTGATVRSEYENKGPAPAFIRYQSGCSSFYISTLTEFTNSEKGFNTLSTMLYNAGIACDKSITSGTDMFFLRDGQMQFPGSAKDKFEKATGDMQQLEVWVWSPRPLDDLLIEPNMPKLNLLVFAEESKLEVNGEVINKSTRVNRDYEYMELPLKQGWNRLNLFISEKDKGDFQASFICRNKSDFLPLLKVSYHNPEKQ